MISRVYTSLDVGHIRLLKFSGTAEDVKCNIKEFSLDALPAEGYVALSYTWEDAELPIFTEIHQPSTPVDITVSGSSEEVHTMTITRNLYDFIHQVMVSGMTHRYYWVDAICINQHDLGDKAIQVNQMKSTYSKAALVTIWLGRPSQGAERTQRTLSLMQQLATTFTAEGKDIRINLANLKDPIDPQYLQRLGLPLTTSMDDWMDLVLFYQRRWFLRVWTIQELALASKAFIAFGANPINPKIVVDCNRLILNTPLQSRLIVEAQNRYTKGTGQKILFNASHEYALALAKGIVQPISNHPAARMWTADNATPEAQTAASFFAMLLGTRFRSATDTRDRVYGLLGVMKLVCERKQHESLPFVADYCKSAANVFTEAMSYVLQTTGSLNYLSAVQYRPSNSIECLPSWVPDFSEPTSQSILNILVTHSPSLALKTFAAAGCDQSPELFDINSQILFTHAAKIGEITHIGESYGELLEHRLDQTIGLLLAAMAIAENIPTVVLAFHSTILCGLEDIELSLTTKFGRMEEAFNIYWKWIIISFVARRNSEHQATRSQSLEEMKGYGLDELAKKDTTSFIPTSIDVVTMCELMGVDEDVTNSDTLDLVAEMYANISNLDFYLRETMQYRRSFLLDNGHFGIGPEHLRVGDRCCILPHGARMPFIFRRSPSQRSSEQQLIGEAYVNGLMQGSNADRNRTWEKIHIV